MPCCKVVLAVLHQLHHCQKQPARVALATFMQAWYQAPLRVTSHKQGTACCVTVANTGCHSSTPTPVPGCEGNATCPLVTRCPKCKCHPLHCQQQDTSATTAELDPVYQPRRAACHHTTAKYPRVNCVHAYVREPLYDAPGNSLCRSGAREHIKPCGQ